MKVKICGINSAEFARQAHAAGADFLGLLLGITHLAEDKITVEEARGIIRDSGVPREKFVMVTHLTRADEIISIINELSLKNVQLHDDISPSEIEKIRASLPALFIMKAVHVLDESAVQHALTMEKHADAIILDSRTKSRLGGTGLVHDWSISREIVKECEKPVFLAGGLNPENVALAVRTVEPYAVDANSGVEYENGDKSEEKMREFVLRAKSAI